MKKIYAPISIGELFDKISILEIKSDRLFNDRSKANNVDYELRELRKIAEEHPIGNYFSKLKEVNEKIWDIEDEIRIKYRRKEYDEEFIRLAQEVHELNDERGLIKKDINIQFKSDIIEEKYHKS